MRFRLLAAALAVSTCALGTTSAQAGVTEINNALDAMSYYNLIATGNVQSKHEVEGRSFIGGNVTGTSNFNTDGLAGYGLRAVGDVKDGWKSVQKGDVQVGGNVSQVNLNGAPQNISYGGTLSDMNVNNPNTKTQVAGLGATMSVEFNSIVSNLSTLSTYLGDLGTTEQVDLGTANKAIFSADTSSSNIAVFTLGNLSELASRQVSFTGVDDYDLVVINVTGAGPQALANSTNFASAFGLGTSVIWNFTQATTLNFAAQNWFGSVLALHTTDVWNASAIEGSMVFGGTFHQEGEVHTDTFGDFRFPPENPGIPGVPEPATWAMMIMGFGAAGSMIRRRRAVAA